MTFSISAPGSAEPALQDIEGPLNLILQRLNALDRLEEILEPGPAEAGPDPQAVLAALERAARLLEEMSRHIPDRLSAIEVRLSELDRLGAERHLALMAMLRPCEKTS